MQIVLRVLVTLLALGGAGGALFAALFIHQTLTQAEQKVCQQLRVQSISEVLKLSEAVTAARLTSPEQVERFNQGLELYLRTSMGVWFLCAAGAFGVLGMFLAIFDRGVYAAALLLTAAVGPAVIMPPVALPGLVVFTGALPVAGLLALGIRQSPRSHRAPAAD